MEYVEKIVEVPEIQIQERIVHVPKQVREFNPRSLVHKKAGCASLRRYLIHSGEGMRSASQSTRSSSGGAGARDPSP